MKYVKTFEDFGGNGYKNITPPLRHFSKITSPDGEKRKFTKEETKVLFKYYRNYSWSNPDNNGYIIFGGGGEARGKYYITEDDLSNLVKKDKDFSNLPQRQERFF